MIDKNVCIGCGTCAGICPVGAIHMEGGKAEVDNSVCVKCGACVNACPVGAIKLD